MRFRRLLIVIGCPRQGPSMWFFWTWRTYRSRESPSSVAMDTMISASPFRDLAYDGVRVTEEDYLRGSPSISSPMRWRDFQLMPRGLHPREIALEQVLGMKARLSEPGASRFIAVLHTPPFEELLGLPPVGLPAVDHAQAASPPSVYAFFKAYLGNRSMGTALWQSRHKIVGVVCGHTHRRAGPISLGGMTGINIGSDYGDPQAALFSSELNQFERLPAL